MCDTKATMYKDQTVRGETITAIPPNAHLASSQLEVIIEQEDEILG
jgi:hypothetical protein